ncbi:YgiW/YdeI family stress tolerance OB fold protein [Photorhabdus caribbeanensis]|uniref:YgiW/YdeI family stress tolerance OB fold protein n=1 Tax=Photorhabdus caribbeanensis TaxID=1004165 RepID=UPI001BD46A4E|nr:YgiW/YdeI family stress tolerance OB fold protein [Photorhabdus caribbeanensis]MBS9424865.1 NirD/YgiW/YdeI family stress tolerance protein [Photorhabdus caribbeanensis]
MMKKIFITTALITLFSMPSIAQTSQTQFGGFSGPDSTQPPVQAAPQGGFVDQNARISTTQQVKNMRDDSWVVLEGHIESRIHSDHFIFRDNAGIVEVEVDHKYWNGQTITPQDRVRLEGEVDKEWNGMTVDVKKVTKLN